MLFCMGWGNPEIKAVGTCIYFFSDLNRKLSRIFYFRTYNYTGYVNPNKHTGIYTIYLVCTYIKIRFTELPYALAINDAFVAFRPSFSPFL